VRLPADPAHPDSTFVEDTAVLTGRGAILARPGAATRRGEVESAGAALLRFYPALRAIAAPGTLDGGDVCQVEDVFFVGLSERTNLEGARQLADYLRGDGFTSRLVDIRGIPGLLHLKSGMATLDRRRLVLAPALAEREEFRGFDLIRVAAGEEYGANCLWMNGSVLIPGGHPCLERTLSQLGYHVLVVEMSEFRKMDGGLSCLSLRLHGASGD
jgi:dimethylargininase